MTDYFVRFVRTLEPNTEAGVQWPVFNTSSRAVLQFNDGDTPLNVTRDVERLAGARELLSLSLRFPL